MPLLDLFWNAWQHVDRIREADGVDARKVFPSKSSTISSTPAPPNPLNGFA